MCHIGIWCKKMENSHTLFKDLIWSEDIDNSEELFDSILQNIHPTPPLTEKDRRRNWVKKDLQRKYNTYICHREVQ